MRAVYSCLNALQPVSFIWACLNKELVRPSKYDHDQYEISSITRTVKKVKSTHLICGECSVFVVY
jgi:hypothetical protein